MRLSILCTSFLWMVCGPVLSLTAWGQKPSSDEKPASPVTVSRVQEREIGGSQTVVGTVQPARRSIVGSPIDGRVMTFPVENGDRVSQGDVLAQLRTQTLEWQLAAARAEQKLRDQELAELKNGTDPEQVANLEARMKATVSQREYADAQFKRIQSLFDRGQVTTQTRLDEARSEALAAEQDFIGAKALHDLAVRGPREERIAQAEARKEMQVALVEQLEDQIARHTIIAPFDGFIVAENTEVGQWASQGDPIAEVVQLSEVDVRANVPEEQVASLRKGQKVTVNIPGAPHQIWEGTVHRIVPQADVRSRTFPVDIRIINSIEDDIPVLKAGFLATMQLPTGATQRATLVPKDALVLGGVQPHVFVVELSAVDKTIGVVRPVEVTLGMSDGMTIKVNGMLTPDQLVVVEGNERLKPGETVRILQEVEYE